MELVYIEIWHIGGGHYTEWVPWATCATWTLPMSNKPDKVARELFQATMLEF